MSNDNHEKRPYPNKWRIYKMYLSGRSVSDLDEEFDLPEPVIRKIIYIGNGISEVMHINASLEDDI